MHQYINEMKEHEFVLWVIGANAKDKGKFVYELPKNVVEVHEVFLDDALRLKDSGKMLHAFTEEETNSLKELMLCRRPNWEILFRLYHDQKLNPMSFLRSGIPEYIDGVLYKRLSIYSVCGCISHNAFYAASGLLSNGK